MIEADAEPSTPGTAATPGPEAASAANQTEERRRPGRPAEVSAALLPLLRGEPTRDISDIADETELLESDWDHDDALKPARGIAFGLLLTVPIWAAVLFTFHMGYRLMTHS